MMKIIDGARQVANIFIMDSRIEIGSRSTGLMFKSCRKPSLGITLMRKFQVLAVARSVVEPHIACHLLGAVAGMPDPLPNRLIGKCLQKCSTYLGSSILEIQSGQARVRLPPNWVLLRAPRLDSGPHHLHIGVGN